MDFYLAKSSINCNSWVNSCILIYKKKGQIIKLYIYIYMGQGLNWISQTFRPNGFKTK